MAINRHWIDNPDIVIEVTAMQKKQRKYETRQAEADPFRALISFHKNIESRSKEIHQKRTST